MEIKPDLAGFADAMERKRTLLGEDIIFRAPEVVTFPSATPLDPETGKPFDPLVAGSAVPGASAVVRASVYFRAMLRAGGAGAEVDTAIGRGEKSPIMLIMGSAAASAVSGKVDFEVHADRYKIEAVKRDSPIRGAPRLVVYGAVEK